MQWIFKKMHNPISPLDGRDRASVEVLQEFFSEKALMFFRVKVEIAWFEFLAREGFFRSIAAGERKFLRALVQEFSQADFEAIKKIESRTNHDVKAVELFLRDKFSTNSLADLSEWIHWALTSEDVNNLAWALILQGASTGIFQKELAQVERELLEFSRKFKATPMLSRTHGQPASPTTLGKEFLVFATRLHRQLAQMQSQEFLGKFAGATGNFNAHAVTFPQKDWIALAGKFVESLNLKFNPVCTQIEPHDFVAEISHNFFRANTILIDLCRDIWEMISRNFFTQKVVKNETGSSAMPHKVNPIDFENCEGNCGLANALFAHFATKLPISRLQRDLSDSTVFRNLGVAFGHTLLALRKLQKGLGKLQVNENALLQDLQSHPEVLAEAVQSVMRSCGVPDSFMKLKEFSRGKQISLEILREFVAKLEIESSQKARLLALLPENYLGKAEEMCERFGQ